MRNLTLANLGDDEAPEAGATENRRKRSNPRILELPRDRRRAFPAAFPRRWLRSRGYGHRVWTGSIRISSSYLSIMNQPGTYFAIFASPC
jgi:hypothetical protein